MFLNDRNGNRALERALHLQLDPWIGNQYWLVGRRTTENRHAFLHETPSALTTHRMAPSPTVPFRGLGFSRPVRGTAWQMVSSWEELRDATNNTLSFRGCTCLARPPARHPGPGKGNQCLCVVSSEWVDRCCSGGGDGGGVSPLFDLERALFR